MHLHYTTAVRGAPEPGTTPGETAMRAGRVALMLQAIAGMYVDEYFDDAG